MLEIGACLCTAQLQQIKKARPSKNYPHPEFAQLIKCPVPVSAAAQAVNHITDEMLQNCENRKTVLTKFQNWLKLWVHKTERPVLLVAHNAKFDYMFIMNAVFDEFSTTHFFEDIASFACSQQSIMECYAKPYKQVSFRLLLFDAVAFKRCFVSSLTLGFCIALRV